MQKLFRQPQECLSVDAETYPDNIMIISPEEMRTRFSGNKQKADTNLPLLSFLQSKVELKFLPKPGDNRAPVELESRKEFPKLSPLRTQS